MMTSNCKLWKLFEKREWLIITIFALILTMLFFHQVFLGRIPVPSDVITGMYYPWLDYKWGLATQVPVQNSLLADAVSITYPFKLLAIQLIKKGQIPLWNPYAFGGYPFLASSTVAILFPTTIFYLALPFNVALIFQTAAQPLIAFFSMYLLMRHFKLRKLPSVFSAISYAFGSFTMIWLEWNSHATTSAFLPLLIYFEDNLIEKKNKAMWGLLFGITVMLQIFAGYMPIVGYTFISLGIYLLLKRNILRNIYRVIKYYVLGLMLSSVYLIPYFELIFKSQRLVEKITINEALTSPWNIIGVIIPDFFGNPKTGNSWGNGNYLNIAIYIGVIGIIMAIIGFKNSFYKKKVKFATLLIFSVFIVTYTNPLSKFLFNLGIWGGTSNTMNRFLFVANFALAILAGYGFASINKLTLFVKLKICITVLALIVGIDLFFVAANNFNLNVFLDLTTEHVNIGLRNSILPILVILVTIIVFLIDHKIRRNKIITKFVLVLVLILELFRFGLKFNTFSLTKYLYPETPVLQYLAKYPNERFVSSGNILPANMWTPYHLESIGGYDAAYPINIGRLIAAANSGSADGESQSKSGTIDSPGSKLFGDANVRYILAKRDSLLSRELLGGNQNGYYRLAFEDGSVVVIENTKSLPRAYFVPKTMIIKGDKALSYMMRNDMSSVAITDEYEFWEKGKISSNANVEYLRISNDKIEIKVSSDRDSFLVVLDTYFPGWEASIDNIPTKIYKTNYTFMGLQVPEGIHLIKLVYKPKSFYVGLLISFLSLIGVILIYLLNIIKFRHMVRQN